MKFTRKRLPAAAVALLVFLAVADPGAAIQLHKEEELGREFMRIVERNFDIIRDPYVIDYLNAVGQRIVRHSPNQLFQYRFFVINEDVYNAFAGPGGHIFINSGLFNAMETEGELAGILAHEIAHVECRHISRRMERASRINLATLAGIVAGIFLGAGGSGQLAQAVTVSAMAAGQSVHLAYSREDEMQADQLGLKFLSKAGYSSEGLLAILRKIRGQQWYGTDQVPSYLRTHPAVEDRLAYLDTWRDTVTSEPESLPGAGGDATFRLAQVRLEALYEDPHIVVRRFADRVARSPQNPLYRYGYGLALSRGYRYPEAVEQYQAALDGGGDETRIHIDLAWALYLSGSSEKALLLLAEPARGRKTRAEKTFLSGRILLQSGRFTEAVDRFERLVQIDPEYPKARYHLGEAYGKLGRIPEAHYFLGLHYSGRGRSRSAVFHLQRALEGLTDPVKVENAKRVLLEEEKVVSSAKGAP